MRIIDTHVHIFERFSGIMDGQPVVSESFGCIRVGNQKKQFLQPNFEYSNSTVEMLLSYMNCNNVEKAILVPNILYGYHNDYYSNAVKQYPDSFKALALVDITKGHVAADELYNYCKSGDFIGLKIEVNSATQYMPDLRLNSNLLDPIWECCNSLKSFVFLHLFRPDDLLDIKSVIENYRSIKYVICHFGGETIFGVRAYPESISLLTELARSRDNVWLETSAIPCFFPDEQYPFPTSCELVENVYKTIGPEKIIWGSDYPGMLNMGTYKQLIDYIIEHCTFPSHHKDLIMGINAQNIFWDNI